MHEKMYVQDASMCPAFVPETGAGHTYGQFPVRFSYIPPLQRNGFNHSPPLCPCSLQTQTAKRSLKNPQCRRSSLYLYGLMKGLLLTTPTPSLQDR